MQFSIKHSTSVKHRRFNKFLAFSSPHMKILGNEIPGTKEKDKKAFLRFIEIATKSNSIQTNGSTANIYKRMLLS